MSKYTSPLSLHLNKLQQGERKRDRKRGGYGCSGRGCSRKRGEYSSGTTPDGAANLSENKDYHFGNLSLKTPPFLSWITGRSACTNLEKRGPSVKLNCVQLCWVSPADVSSWRGAADAPHGLQRLGGKSDPGVGRRPAGAAGAGRRDEVYAVEKDHQQRSSSADLTSSHQRTHSAEGARATLSSFCGQVMRFHAAQNTRLQTAAPSGQRRD